MNQLKLHMITVTVATGSLDFQLVNDGFDLLKARSLVGVSIPADVNDPLQMMVDGGRDHWTSMLLCYLHPQCVHVSMCE